MKFPNKNFQTMNIPRIFVSFFFLASIFSATAKIGRAHV